MAIDFPASPTNGQTYTVGSVTYTYDGTKWTAVTGSVMLDKIQEGNTSAEVIDTGSDGRFVVTTEGTERLRVDSSGRLGIGTTSPAQSFHLNNARGSTFRYTSTSSDLLDIGWASSSYGAASAGDAHFYTNTGDYCFMADNASKGIKFATGGSTERARIDSSGRLLVGTSTSVNTSNGFAPGLQVLTQGIANAISLGRYVNDQYSSVFAFLKNRNTSIGSHTIVSSGDMIGRIQWDASDGTVYRQAAEISAYVDGTPGNDDMPGRLVFSTSPDGATSPVERMRITNTGEVLIATSTPVLGTYGLTVGFTSAFPSGLRLQDGGGVGWSGNPVIRNNNGSGYLICMNGTGGGVGLANGGTSWSSLSDENYKTDLQPIEQATEKVSSLRTVTGRFIDDPEAMSRSFLIAQDVEAVLPEAVSTADDGRKLLSYTDIIPLLTAAFKEALTEIETLKAKVAALEAS